MDGVLLTISSLEEKISQGMNNSKYLKSGSFEDLKPIKGAVEAFNLLAKYFDVCILSTPMWSNPDFGWVKNMGSKLPRNVLKN